MSEIPVWRQKPKATKDGYTKYPDAVTRPLCDMCGPFRAPELRVIGRDEFGKEYRCRGCDEED